MPVQVVNTQADLTALLNTAAAKSVANPSHFTGITTLKDSNLVVLGLSYVLNGGASYSVTFKTVALNHTFMDMETNLSGLNTEIDNALLATPKAISGDLFLLQGQLFLIVTIRQ